MRLRRSASDTSIKPPADVSASFTCWYRHCAGTKSVLGSFQKIGRSVTLLGDAAHATLQSLAQGAGMALEDAAYLANLLALAEDDIETALLQFQHDRVIRTSRVQLESRLLWDVYHAEDDIVRDVRRQQYQERTAEDYYRCLTWLWKPIELPAAMNCTSDIRKKLRK